MTEGLFAFRRVRKSFCVSQKREETAQPLLPVLSQESLNFIEVELAFGHQNLQVTGLGKQWRTSFANLVSKTRKAFSFEGVSWKIQNEELFILCAQMVKISRKVKPFIKILSARLKSWPWTNLKKSAGLALEQRSFSASLRSFLSPFFPPPLPPLCCTPLKEGTDYFAHLVPMFWKCIPLHLCGFLFGVVVGALFFQPLKIKISLEF